MMINPRSPAIGVAFAELFWRCIIAVDQSRIGGARAAPGRKRQATTTIFTLSRLTPTVTLGKLSFSHTTTWALPNNSLTFATLPGPSHGSVIAAAGQLCRPARKAPASIAIATTNCEAATVKPAPLASIQTQRCAGMYASDRSMLLRRRRDQYRSKKRLWHVCATDILPMEVERRLFNYRSTHAMRTR